MNINYSNNRIKRKYPKNIEIITMMLVKMRSLIKLTTKILRTKCQNTIKLHKNKWCKWCKEIIKNNRNQVSHILSSLTNYLNNLWENYKINIFSKRKNLLNQNRWVILNKNGKPSKRIWRSFPKRPL
jgi:hypothetical protein